MRKFKIQPLNIKVTFSSIKKLDRPLNFELIVIDEPHELSLNQQVILKEKLNGYKGYILGLTGTLTNKTKNELYDNLKLDTCYTYDIIQGVEDRIITDYQMFIHTVPLDNKIKKWGRKSAYTEKKWFDNVNKIKQNSNNPATKHFMNLKMINIIQNSLSKLNRTKELINMYSKDRLLIFCGVTKIADDLGIPVYHSKAREKDIFHSFCSGEGKHLATIKMMQAGITINPINKGIINYMSGNPEDSTQKICRFLGFEYSNPQKKAEIHIISSNEEFEISRLRTGLSFFDYSKIRFLN